MQGNMPGSSIDRDFISHWTISAPELGYTDVNHYDADRVKTLDKASKKKSNTKTHKKPPQKTVRLHLKINYITLSKNEHD